MVGLLTIHGVFRCFGPKVLVLEDWCSGDQHRQYFVYEDDYKQSKYNLYNMTIVSGHPTQADSCCDPQLDDSYGLNPIEQWSLRPYQR